jgi:hypothetical protein
MSRKRWHILREGEVVTLTRALPPRFDVVASTVLPDARRVRLAHQVRQDIWRALRAVRGFSPVVEVVRREGALHVRAGGRVAPPIAAGLTGRLSEVLEDAATRQRWLTHAGASRC